MGQGYNFNFAHGSYESEVMSSLATKFADATGRKYAGHQTQKGGTLGVDQTAEKGRRIVKELNAIVTKKLRKTDPVLLGVWKAASRLEQPPQRTPGEDGAAQPSSPAPAPAVV
jgi:hypothetical protein